MKFVELEKMSKKARKEYHKAHRQTNGFNTGSRVMKSAKHPSRAELKARSWD